MAAEALREVLSDSGLSSGSRGQVIACVGGNETFVREATLPLMSDDEFRQALPFEARKFLSLESVEDPVIDGQIIERVEADGEEDPGSTLVMMAATSGRKREFTLEALAGAGIEPTVIDVEPLACLNTMLNLTPTEDQDMERAQALLDLGGHRANLLISYRGSGLLSRDIWKGTPSDGSAEGNAAYARDIATRTLETLTFYRGRYRREVDTIYLTGGSSMKSGLAEELSRVMNREVVPCRPLEGIADQAVGYDENKDMEALFVTACGLCRWGDDDV